MEWAMSSTTKGCLAISLLGPVEISIDGNPVTKRTSDKAQALLAYLALHTGPPLRREILAGLLWPEHTDASALHNLRQTLVRLRRALSVPGRSSIEHVSTPSFLEVTQRTIGIDRESDYWLDVELFSNALAASETHAHERLERCMVCIERLREAVELYRGDLLAGLFLDSVPFEEWLTVQREHLRGQALNGLRALATYHQESGELELVLRYARRQLELEPWHEEAHRQVMRALVLDGQRSAAMAQYETCRQVLATELAVEPAAETTALYTRIRDGEALSDPSAPAAHNLPASLTPFVGRTQERRQIETLLNDPACRLLTIVGAGGMGKTRLALEAAREQASRYKRPVCWVSLAPLHSIEALVPSITHALSATFGAWSGGQEDRPLVAPGALFHYLRDKKLVLVLDNCEHLVAGLDLASEILRAAPGVRILATSRTALNLQGEHVLYIGGLDYSETADASGKLSPQTTRHAAAELFVQGARRARADVVFSPRDRVHIERICHLVQGMPLAVLLAAGWTVLLSPQEIADEISQGLGLFETNLRDVPERHQSLRAVFEGSWDLISARERSVMQALSVFRGGFDRRAAEHVAGASLRDLLALSNQSLLQQATVERYDVHELLRQYAAEKLDRAPERDRIRDQHCTYYVDLAVRHEVQVWHGEQQALLREMDNVRAAWRWAIERRLYELALKLLPALWILYVGRGWYTEAAATFGWAASVLEAGEARAQADPAPGILLGQCLTQQGSFVRYTGHADRGRALAREGIQILEGLDAELALAEGYRHAYYAGLQDDPAIKAGLEKGLETYRRQGITWRVPSQLITLSQFAVRHGAYDEAEGFLREALETSRRSGDLSVSSGALAALGDLAAWTRCEYGAARQLYEESLATHPDTAHGRGLVLLSLGQIAMALHEFEEARARCEQAWAAFQDRGHRAGTARAHSALGALAASLGQTHQAQVHLEHALGFAAEWQGIWAEETRCEVVLGVAHLYARSQNPERALELAALVRHRSSGSVLSAHVLAKDLCVELRARLSPQSAAAAEERGRRQEIETKVRELLKR